MTNINKSTRKGVGKVEEKSSISNKSIAKNSDKSTKKSAINKSDSKSKKLKLPLIRKVHIRPTYLILSAVVTILAIFFIRVSVWEHNYLAAMEGSARDVAAIEVNETTATEEVDDTEPTEQQIVEYVVAPDKPRYFSIPYLGIYNARIVEIGLKGQNEMATPYNIYDVGWFTGSGSVLPGQNGVTFINAHGGDLGYGIFRSLPKLPVGEVIKIEMGDGRVYTYKVVEKEFKELGEDANKYMSNFAFAPLSGTTNTLSMVTCTGDWWESQQTYSQRLFVRAALQ